MTTFIPDLKPLSTGQILDRGIRLYRQHFLTFIGIIALAQIPATLVTVIAALVVPAPEIISTSPADVFSGILSQTTGIGSGLLSAVILLLTTALSVLGMAALVRAATNSYLARPSGILESYRGIGRPWASVLVTYVLAGLLSIGLMLWWIFVPVLGWATGLGMLFFLSLVVLQFAVPCIVIERQPITEALWRAWDLARRRFWWLVGFMLLLGLFGQIIVTGPALLATAVIQSFTVGGGDVAQARIIQQLIGLLLNIIYLPLQLTCVTLLYFDARVRTEGLDLALQTIDTTADNDIETELAQLLQNPPTRQRSVLPSWTEMAYFFGLTGGMVLIICGLYAVLIFISLAVFGMSGF